MCQKWIDCKRFYSNFTVSQGHVYPANVCNHANGADTIISVECIYQFLANCSVSSSWKHFCKILLLVYLILLKRLPHYEK
jgi:hypothetical protein